MKDAVSTTTKTSSNGFTIHTGKVSDIFIKDLGIRSRSNPIFSQSQLPPRGYAFKSQYKINDQQARIYTSDKPDLNPNDQLVSVGQQSRAGLHVLAYKNLRNNDIMCESRLNYIAVAIMLLCFSGYMFYQMFWYYQRSLSYHSRLLSYFDFVDIFPLLLTLSSLGGAIYCIWRFVLVQKALHILKKYRDQSVAAVPDDSMG